MARRPVTRPIVAVAVAVAGAAAVLVLVPGVALAHASFDVRQLPAGSTQELVLRVPLERDAANDLVEVLVPGAFTVDACDGTDGWTCRQETTGDGNTVLTFERAPDGPGDAERFTLTVTASDHEGVYPFPTIQTYDDGEEAAWIGEPGSDHPAPRIQVGDESTPVEFSGDATPHTELTDEPTAAPTVAPDPVPAPSVTPDEASDEPTAEGDDAGSDDAGGDDAGEVAGGGAVLAIAAAAVIVAVVVVVVLLLRRWRQ